MEAKEMKATIWMATSLAKDDKNPLASRIVITKLLAHIFASEKVRVCCEDIQIGLQEIYDGDKKDGILRGIILSETKGFEPTEIE